MKEFLLKESYINFIFGTKINIEERKNLRVGCGQILPKIARRGVRVAVVPKDTDIFQEIRTLPTKQYELN